MSSAAWIFSGIVWISIVMLGVAAMAYFSPAKQVKKPLDRDALEAADAALRGRINDLEDRFEHFVKRQAGRTSRENADSAAAGSGGSPGGAQSVLELTRLARARGLR